MQALVKIPVDVSESSVDLFGFLLVTIINEYHCNTITNKNNPYEYVRFLINAAVGDNTEFITEYYQVNYMNNVLNNWVDIYKALAATDEYRLCGYIVSDIKPIGGNIALVEMYLPGYNL